MAATMDITPAPLPPLSLRSGAPRALRAPQQLRASALQAWQLQVGSAGATAALADGSRRRLPPHWKGLLLTAGGWWRLEDGSCLLLELAAPSLARLLACIDCAWQRCPAPQPAPAWAWVDYGPAAAASAEAAAQSCLAALALGQCGGDAAALRLLRRSESYALLRYLLDQADAPPCIADLGRRYGLSDSHFRRLCQQALRGGTKRALTRWRLARSLFDVIEGQDSLTSIAMRHHYATPSHFSNDCRSLLGCSPSELTDATRLLRYARRHC